MATRSGDTDTTVHDLGAGRGPDWLDSWLHANLTELVRWRRHLHTYPELARNEFATTGFISSVLSAFDVTHSVLPHGTGVIADVGRGESCVALRADIDALPLTEDTGLPFASVTPVAAHCCGHDAHTAILLGVAAALASAPEDPGRVRLIFQPAEEALPAGSLDVIAAGGLDGVERIFGLHCDPGLPVGQFGTLAGSVTSASDLVELRLHSAGGHSSRSHLTSDLIYALGTVITSLPGILSRRVDPRSGTVLSWGEIQSGSRANILPGEGILRGTLRTGERTVWPELEPLVRAAIASVLAPTGVDFDLSYQRGVPPAVCDPQSTELLDAGVRAGLGSHALTTARQSSGGEDFAWYLEHVPGAFGRLGVWSGRGVKSDLHRSTFRLDERALPAGVRILTHTALAALCAT